MPPPASKFGIIRALNTGRRILRGAKLHALSPCITARLLFLLLRFSGRKKCESAAPWSLTSHTSRVVCDDDGREESLCILTVCSSRRRLPMCISLPAPALSFFLSLFLSSRRLSERNNVADRIGDNSGKRGCAFFIGLDTSTIYCFFFFSNRPPPYQSYMKVPLYYLTAVAPVPDVFRISRPPISDSANF